MIGEPSAAGGTVGPVWIDYAARLALVGDLDESPLLPGSWYVTHPLGGPAAGTFTEVVLPGEDVPEHIADQLVRRVALDLYGMAWAFIYRPEQYEHDIARHGMRRRERVTVTRLIYSDQREEPRT